MQFERTFYTDTGPTETGTPETGAGQPVIMIHGWACDGSDWSWLSAALDGTHRIIVPDLRGHGRSGAGESYRPEDFAADILSLIGALDLHDVVIVGHSLGAIVASLIASANPELVAGLILVDASYGETPESMERMLAAVKVVPHKIALAAFRSFASEFTPHWLPTWQARRLLGTPADVVRDTMLGMFENDGIGLLTIAEPMLRRRTAPIFAIYAGNHEEQAQWERSLNPTSTVEVWPGHGHFLHQEDPKRFAVQVIAWLRLLSSR